MAKEYPWQNLSLANLKGEWWKDIEGFEGYYQLSCYGRIKSLARWVENANKSPYFRKERIRKIGVGEATSNIQLTLHKEGGRYIQTVPRLIYHHFVERIDLHCHTFLITRKDGDYYNIHSKNLEKRNGADIAREGFLSGKRKSIFQNQQKQVSQYALTGELIKTYQTVKAASLAIGIPEGYISGAALVKSRPSGLFYWRYGKAKKKINVKPLQKRLKNVLRCLPKRIEQYSLTGKYIRTFETMGAAAKSVKLHSSSGISLVCMGKQ